jgi:cyclase
MVLAKRIVPCLDMTGGRVVKGINFVNLQDAGDPVALAAAYDDQGADELTFLDITASSDKREILVDVVERTANQVNIPFTVGGGLRTVDDIRCILRAGADKASVNTAAVQNPQLIADSSQIFGAQCIVTAIDAKRVYVADREDAPDCVVLETPQGLCWWEVYIHGGRTPTGKDAILWGQEAVELGSGEILLTSMDRDGTKEGFDIELTREFSERLPVPIIASGGCGSAQDIADVLTTGKADAALAASIFHYGELTIAEVKQFCAEQDIPMRLL